MDPMDIGVLVVVFAFPLAVAMAYMAAQRKAVDFLVRVRTHGRSIFKRSRAIKRRKTEPNMKNGTN
jgi:hypothetical protein